MKTLLMLCLIALITGCNSDTPQRKAEKLLSSTYKCNFLGADNKQ